MIIKNITWRRYAHPPNHRPLLPLETTQDNAPHAVGKLNGEDGVGGRWKNLTN